MGQSAPRLHTYDDLRAATRPDAAPPELVCGRIVHRASPRPRHGHVQHNVSGLLFSVGGGDDQGWWLLVEPDVRFTAHTVLRPDLAGWRRRTLPRLPDGPVDVTPDWICETLSPGHENHDRITKMALYAEHGVAWAWLVHPEERRLEVYALRDGLWTLRGAYTDGAVEPVPPFDDVVIDLARLFGPRDGEPPDLAGEGRVAYRAG